MSSLLTLAILIGVSAVLFVMLLASGKKKTASPTVSHQSPAATSHLSKEEAVVLEWYDGVKKAEFREAVLKDIATKLKKPVSE